MAARPMTGAAGDGRVAGIIHVHTDYSHDGRDTLEGLRDFALAKGLAFVGITDHAEDLTPARYDECRARCAALSDARVRLIPGLEYRFAGHPGLHLLALGLDRYITPATPADFMAQVRGAARFTIAAHPVLFDYRLPDAVRDGIDAIEVWNATYNRRYLPDPRAIALYDAVRAARPAVVATAGPDQHDSRNDRGIRVLVDAVESDPLAALKAGRFENVGVTMRFDSRATFGPLRLTLLRAGRLAFDAVDRVHERLGQARKRRRARAAADAPRAGGRA